MVSGCIHIDAKGIHRLLVAAVMLAFVLAGCRQGEVRGIADDPRRASLDSAVSLVTDVDTLEEMAQHYRQCHDKLGEMLVLKQQGRVLRNLARFEEASRVLEKKLDIATSLADTLEMSEALNNLGITNRRIGNMSVANGYHYQSLKLLDAYSGHDGRNFLRVKALTLNGIGNIEIELYDFTVADSVLHDALECERRLDNMEGLAINCCDLGKAKREMGEYDSAGYYLRKAMEYSRLCGYEKGVARSHLGMGELNEKQQLISHAEEEYKQAYDIFKAINDSWYLQQTGLALARASLLLDDREDAHRYLHEAEAEAQRTGSKIHLADASMIHYELSLLKGDTHEALEHYVRGNNLYDSIFGKEKSEEMHDQRVDYQNGVKKGEVDMLNRDIDNLKRLQRMQLWFLFLILAMAVAVILALAYVMRERMRTQRLMKHIEETRSLFFTNVVHRLRTPLTAIMGAVDSIIGEADAHEGDETKDGQAMKGNASLIARQSKNLMELMDRILEVGSVRSTITELDWRTGDAVIYLRMLLETYREQCVERHIELTYSPSEPSVTIDTVPRYLNTIVHSLIENAFNYSRDFSQIMVSTQVEDDFLVLRVADNGMGISSNDLPHIFEPFYRGVAAEQLMDGVGIGLTVVRDMAMALGGTVDVESVLEQGSVFTVKLPCRYSGIGVKGKLEKVMPSSRQLLTRQQRHENLPAAADSPATSDKPVVLVVEDSADVARLVGSVLEKDFTVCFAQDGKQGMTMAAKLVPDVIITDVKMPLMDGFEFTERIRASDRLRHIPVIILSARTSDEARLRGIKAGANSYLVKPFLKEELLGWVNNFIKMREYNWALASKNDACAKESPLPITDLQDDDDEFLQLFARAVEDQLTCCEKLDLDKIALSFRMGESQLRRKINDLTGKSITAHITQLRMEKALRLLRQDPDVLIGDVAVQCGFADVAYFSRVFRSHYGKTPTQARNEMNGGTND